MTTRRAVPEWIGKTPDTPVPPRVRLRVFDRKKGCCHRCSRKINAGEAWTLEHLKALINEGQNRESNLTVTCDWCLPVKNAEDVAEKSKTYKQRSGHVGIKKSSKPLQSRNDFPPSRKRKEHPMPVLSPRRPMYGKAGS